MTENARLCASFVVGAVVGSAAAFFITRGILKTRYEEALNDLYEIHEKRASETHQNASGDDFENGDEGVDRFEKASQIANKDSLEKLAQKYRSKHWDAPADNVGDDWDLGDIENLAPNDGPAEKPYLITEEDFSEGNLTYDKVTLYYHDGDSTFIEEGVPFDEFDQKMVEDSLGPDVESALYSAPDGTIYIRNENLGIDYMIVLEKDSYGQEIVGSP